MLFSLRVKNLTKSFIKNRRKMAGFQKMKLNDEVCCCYKERRILAKILQGSYKISKRLSPVKSIILIENISVGAIEK